MFDVGFTELFLLALIGLLVLGPERLPGIARKIGSVLRQARQSWNVMKRTVEAEMARSGMDESVRQAQQNLRDIGRQVSDLPGALQDAAARPGPASPAAATAPEAPSASQAGAGDAAGDPGGEAQATAGATAAERTEDGPEGKPAAFTGPVTDPAPGNPATVPPRNAAATTEHTGKGDERTGE